MATAPLLILKGADTDAQELLSDCHVDKLVDRNAFLLGDLSRLVQERRPLHPVLISHGAARASKCTLFVWSHEPPP
jgi:hypothetical protein